MARADLIVRAPVSAWARFRKPGIDGRYVQHCHQSSIDTEYRSARATQVYVSRPVMLASVDGDGSLLGNAGADAVRALHLLGPHAAEPGSPIFEKARLRLFTAVFDGDARTITEQDSISCLPNHSIELVELLLRREDELFERSAKTLQLARREDAWRLAVVGIDAVLVRRSLPGARYLLYPRRRRRSLGDRIDVVGVPCHPVVRSLQCAPNLSSTPVGP